MRPVWLKVAGEDFFPFCALGVKRLLDYYYYYCYYVLGLSLFKKKKNLEIAVMCFTRNNGNISSRTEGFGYMENINDYAFLNILFHFKCNKFHFMFWSVDTAVRF